jgi:hypothetical protein
MALLAFGWQARKEALGDEPAPRRDRVDEADRARAETRSPAIDRVEEADRIAAAAAAAQTDRRADQPG